MSQIPSNNTHKSRFNGWSKLFLLFFVVLAVSLLIFIVNNERRHDLINKARYSDCLQYKQIADNQRRVITALLKLEKNEEKEHKPVHLVGLKKALTLVPVFHCEQLKKGG